MKNGNADDPKGLIFEAYRIDGITRPECRTIFLDWALSLPDDMDAKDAITRVLATYAPGAPDHPMTEVLQEGLAKFGAAKCRGGWRSRARPPL